MTKNQYYKIMSNFDKDMSFEELHEKWFKCFDYILRLFKVGFNKKSIKSLFYDFDMENWKAMHKENSVEYKDHTKEQLIDEFCGECDYISDRTSYDRLFRTHWLFRQAFEKEIDKIRYPFLYKDKK
jgi:hypothetical protein